MTISNDMSDDELQKMVDELKELLDAALEDIGMDELRKRIHIISEADPNAPSEDEQIRYELIFRAFMENLFDN